MLMSTESGALHTDRAFLIKKSRGDEVMSANEPNANVMVAKESPMMVRYWKCQP